MFIGTKDKGVKPKMGINGRRGEREKGRKVRQYNQTINGINILVSFIY